VKQGTKNVVASVLARLRNEAAAQGAPFNQVLQLYVIERFLYRLSKSRHVDGVVLKGALLLKTVGLPERGRLWISIFCARERLTGKPWLPSSWTAPR
jgi:hypothetical protein